MLKTMDEGIQDRRLGTIGCWTEDWETEKVGDAKLFEKLQSRVRGILRYSDIADNNNDCAYDTNYDNGTYNTMKNRCQPDTNNNSAYYTNNTCYRLEAI